MREGLLNPEPEVPRQEKPEFPPNTHTYHTIQLSFVPQQDVAVASFSSKPQRQVTPNNESIIRMRVPAVQNREVDEYKHTMTGSGNHWRVLTF